MKRRIPLILCAVVTVSRGLAACSPGHPVEIACDEFYEQQHIQHKIEVQVGRSFTIELRSNPSTGVAWGEAAISDLSVVAEIRHEYQAPGGIQPPALGTPGVEVWTFEATEPGQSTIASKHGQPREEGREAECTFVLSVVGK